MTGITGQVNAPGVYTWATRPAASANTGRRITISDVGIGGGSQWQSSGTDWHPVGGSVKLYVKNDTAAHTGTSSKTVQASFSVPAGLMGLNGQLRIYQQHSLTNSANAKTPTVEFGGTVFWNPSGVSLATLTAYTTITNRGSAAVQVGSASFAGMTGSTTGTKTSGTVDTTAAQTLQVSYTLASSGESAMLDFFIVELHK
jgi:hypothetical protein